MVGNFVVDHSKALYELFGTSAINLAILKFCWKHSIWFDSGINNSELLHIDNYIWNGIFPRIVSK